MHLKHVSDSNSLIQPDHTRDEKNLALAPSSLFLHRSYCKLIINYVFLTWQLKEQKEDDGRIIIIIVIIRANIPLDRSIVQ
ncbi:hypothetical protein BLOT_004816 [Blomia tropicalis]|nr:hypothetical protein BLOT_004816 [Blomia tropicalis]